MDLGKLPFGVMDLRVFEGSKEPRRVSGFGVVRVLCLTKKTALCFMNPTKRP